MSAGVEWALHCTVLLAVLKPTSRMPGRALAEFHGVSESYLLKHMQALTKAGICESVPGPTGGYRLSRPADQITLLDIVEAIEGPEPAFRCDEIRQRGPTALAPSTYTVQCGIHSVMLEAELAWKQSLRARTLADLTPRSIETMDKRRVDLATTWILQNVRRGPDATDDERTQGVTPRQDRIETGDDERKLQESTVCP
ncbi:MAG: Rrf2 family transcriptional regulator [Chloroflexota bacterium]